MVMVNNKYFATTDQSSAYYIDQNKPLTVTSVCGNQKINRIRDRDANKVKGKEKAGEH